MTSAIAKLGAVVAAGALLATAAMPAYADISSSADSTTSAHSTDAVQNVAIVTTATAAAAAAGRDGYSVTKPQPVLAAHIMVNKFTGVTPPAQGYSGSALIAYAAQFVGKVPYGEGNSPTTSFSCDGYTQYVFAGFGISLPRGADHQARLGVQIPKADAVAGDLIWWPGQHVGIYDGAGGMYNSPTWGRYVEHTGSIWGNPVYIRLTL